MATELTFRVHFTDGTKLDVNARDAKTAGQIAEGKNPSKISKIKLVRE